MRHKSRSVRTINLTPNLDSTDSVTTGESRFRNLSRNLFYIRKHRSTKVRLSYFRQPAIACNPCKSHCHNLCFVPRLGPTTMPSTMGPASVQGPMRPKFSPRFPQLDSELAQSDEPGWISVIENDAYFSLENVSAGHARLQITESC